MYLKNFELLSDEFKNDEVKRYYTYLEKKKTAIFLKRCFDLIVSLILFIVLIPLFIIISVSIKIDSKGKVFFVQNRVTQYGRIFKIYKFRTMVENADKLGNSVTVKNDMRVTHVGRFLRKCRLDEIPQLLNIIKGDMSFVGTRPEVPLYVEQYSEEMYATLLLPAGVTSLASIYYKDEEKLLSDSENADSTYINEVLPQKMYYNLKYINKFSFWHDIKIMMMTVLAVCGVEYKDERTITNRESIILTKEEIKQK